MSVGVGEARGVGEEADIFLRGREIFRVLKRTLSKLNNK